MEFLNFADQAAVREYEDFVESRGGSYLQSAHWCGVKQNWRHEAVLSRDSQGRLRATALVLVKKFPPPLRPFLYCPRGPVWDYVNVAAFEDLMEGLEELSRKYRAYYCKMDPQVEE